MGGRYAGVTEDVAVFGAQSLVGVVSRPLGVRDARLPGVVLLSPGLLHRVGPNRLYVKLARVLAGAGFSVLRFDFSGRGDSPPRLDGLSMQQSAISETRDAIDYLQGVTGCGGVLLIGHCSGAILSAATAFTDERVWGIVSISPEGGDEDWVEFDRRQKEARYYANYYGKAAMTDSSRWKRLLTGKVSYASIARNMARGVAWNRVAAKLYRTQSRRGTKQREAAHRHDVQEYKRGMQDLVERGVPMLLVHPDQSSGPELLRSLLGDTLKRMQASGALQIAFIEGSDHMFTPLAAQQDLVQTVLEWTQMQSAPVSPMLAVSAVP